MLKAFKKADAKGGPFRRLSDSEILLFVSRTLQTRGSEQEAHDIFNKLQSLTDILDQQEVDLLNWPNSPAKDRFYASHLKAKALTAQIADYLGAAAKADQAASDKEAG